MTSTYPGSDENRALKYRCPTCNAEPGARCRTDTTNNGKPARRKKRNRIHPARHAKRILAEGS
ncbi:zinc finger domain-containing protein [Methylobacterium fujisawaense]